MQTIINNRYQLIDLLGEGGMGAVYRAKDRLTGNIIALKQVLIPTEQPGASRMESSLSDAANMRLAITREFRALASLRHPHVINVLDYGFDAEQHPFFTMTLLQNTQDFLEAAAGHDSIGKVKLLIQMLQALAYLHRRGLIHRDLKPANVLVDNAGHLRVLDFGLAVGQKQSADIAGTLRYMAPEVLQGRPITPVADLFAVGVIAYEMFTGKHPFTSEMPSAMVMNIIMEPPDLSSMPTYFKRKPPQPNADDAEPDFDDNPLTEIIGRLLVKDPSDRYQDAYQVINDLDKLFLQGGSIRETREIRESFLQAAAFVGREVELQRLTDSLNAIIRTANTQTMPMQQGWLIGGESGVGKSRLVDELRIRALVDGVTVLRGQAVDGGGLTYQPWREVVRRLVLSSTLTDLEAGVLKQIVPDIELLLERSIPAAPGLGAESADIRLRSTIGALFRNQMTPTLLVMEDLQWMLESLDLLVDLLKMAIDRHLPLMIVGTYRDDERPNLPEKLPDAELLSLTRFGDAEIAALTQSMLGEIGKHEGVLDLIQRETEGNAFFMVEVVRALAEEAGQLSDVGTRTLPIQVFSGGIQKVVTRRLEGVPVWGHALLQLAAIIGRAVDPHMLKMALDAGDMVSLYDHDFEAWLTACVNAAVFDVQDEQYRFAHDKLREVLLAQLTPQQHVDLNRVAALTIEAVYADNLDEYAASLADHWRIAENTAKEIEYAIKAGDKAADVNNQFSAQTFFRRALLLLPDTPSVDRAESLIGLAHALTSLGIYDEALVFIEDAITTAETLDDKVRIVKYQSAKFFIWLQTAQYDRAVPLAEAVVEATRPLNDDQLLVKMLDELAFVYVRVGNISGAIRCQEEAQQLVDPEDRMAILQNSVRSMSILTSQGKIGESIEVGERALAIALEINDVLRIRNILGNLAVTYWFKGLPDKAKSYLKEVMDIPFATSNAWSYTSDLNTLGYVETDLGNYAAARAHFLDALPRSLNIKALSLTLDILGGLAQLSIKSDDKSQIEYGLEIMGVIQAHPAYNNDVRSSIMPIIEAATAKIGTEQAAAAQERGKALDFDALLKEMRPHPDE